MVRTEFGGRVSHALPQERSLSTAFDAVTEMSRASFQADVRVKMAHIMRAIIGNLVAEVTVGHIQAVIEQAVLRELCSMLHPTEFAAVPKSGKFIDLMPEGFETTATFTKFADNSAKNVRAPALVSADTSRTLAMDHFKQPVAAVESACGCFPETAPVNFALEDIDSFKKENCDQAIMDCDEWKASLVEEIPQPAKVNFNEAPKQVAVCNEPTSNDPVSEKGPVPDTNGTADWVHTAAKGKEQDDDDDDDEDDDDDDDYEEEEEEENDNNKIEPGDEEEDVEGEDEEGEEEAGDEDGDDDGEADDNGEGQEDEGDEEGEEEDDVEGDDDADEDGEDEPEEDEEDGEEDPEDEDEDEVEGESEEDIEDLEPPKKKRK